jgi:hypothetical protein
LPLQVRKMQQLWTARQQAMPKQAAKRLRRLQQRRMARRRRSSLQSSRPPTVCPVRPPLQPLICEEECLVHVPVRNDEIMPT